MFGKNFCSDTVASKSADIFVDLRGKIQKGIDEINGDTSKLRELEADLKGKIENVQAGILKNVANVKSLEVKKDALDQLI